MEETPFTNQDKWKTRAYKGIAAVAGCALIWVLLYIFGVLWQAVATVITTAVIAFMLHGFVNWLESKGFSRGMATVLSILGLLVLIFAFFAALVPPIADQIVAFSAAAPDYFTGAQEVISEGWAIVPADNTMVNDFINQASQWLQEQSGALLQNAAGGIFKGVFNVGNALLIFFIALICAFWVLIDLPTISVELMNLFNEEQQRTVHVVTGAFNTAVYGWAKATLACAVIVGVANGIAYWLLGVPYFALLGVVCGVLYFIPYIGSMLAAFISVLAALLVSPLVAIIVLAINVVVHNIVANVISPKLMESSVNVHPAVILIAILVGGALGGMVGMLFSIPIAAAIQGVFVSFFEERTGKVLATEDGALFQKPKVKFKPTWRKREEKPRLGTKENPQEAEESAAK